MSDITSDCLERFSLDFCFLVEGILMRDLRFKSKLNSSSNFHSVYLYRCNSIELSLQSQTRRLYTFITMTLSILNVIE